MLNGGGSFAQVGRAQKSYFSIIFSFAQSSGKEGKGKKVGFSRERRKLREKNCYLANCLPTIRSMSATTYIRTDGMYSAT